MTAVDVVMFALTFVNVAWAGLNARNALRNVQIARANQRNVDALCDAAKRLDEAEKQVAAAQRLVTAARAVGVQ